MGNEEALHLKGNHHTEVCNCTGATGCVVVVVNYCSLVGIIGHLSDIVLRYKQCHPLMR